MIPFEAIELCENRFERCEFSTEFNFLIVNRKEI